MTKSAVAYWVAQYNAVVATLATRTAERDSARNSLYVSGVYQSGNTWQAQDAIDLANYNAEVAAYNDMVSQRDTWHARADSAWGASRVWNSGESWEAAYNRVLEPIGGTGYGHLAASGSGSARNGSLETVATVGLDRTGMWLIIGRNNMTDTSFGGDDNGKVHLIVNGSDVAQSEKTGGNSQGWTGTHPGLSCWAVSVWSSGVNAHITVANAPDRNCTGYIDAYFIPTQSYPH